ncbi:putative disease resistance protein At5g47280 isoform X6 [Nymphaea colorata]|uniref:putative disease resistance protein At5g47280 isoform X6 n=1 Tax=Nymphaea colorata TaxID=210225 RepID=UPI00214EE5CC|nr:putative disease resistance protein At5g47280 isoform X6 [Nymphaea colorata]
MVEPISISAATIIKGLIKVIEEVRKTHELFNTEFEKLKSLLITLEPRVESVRDFDEKTAHHLSRDKRLSEVRQQEMAELLQKLKECDLLVKKSIKVPMWNTCLVRVYAERLKEQNESLRNFVNTNMIIDVWEITRTTRTAGTPVFSGTAVPEPPEITVGWVKPVEELKQKLFLEEVSVLGICGLGGCGKTTLAAKFCEQVKDKFYKISFLPISRTPNLLEMVSRLWRDLLSDVGKLPEFQDVDDAMNLLNSGLKEWKPERGMVLVVLDDVWPDSEVEKLVIRKRPGFKTLVTTRGGLNWLDHSYQVPKLGMEEAKSLFFHYAQYSDQGRRRSKPRLVEQIVEGCMRLPLALKVIGASLKNQGEWKLKETATKIATGRQTVGDPFDQIVGCLESSVESLSDKQRDCFMDFICFPNNKRIRAAAVMDIWVQIRGETELGAFSILKDLADRHLIEVFERRRNEAWDEDEGFGDLFVTQHDLLRKLADCTSQKTKKTRLIINQTDECPNADLTSEAQIVALEMGDGKKNFDTYIPPIFPCAEVLILNFSHGSCSLPSFLKEIETLKLLIIANGSSTAAELSRLPPSSSLKNLRSVRLERISLPILHTFAEPFLGLQKLSMVLCEVREEESSPVFEVPNIFPEMTEIEIEYRGEEKSPHVFDIPNILPEITEIEIDYCNGLERLPTSVCDIPNLKKLSITNCHDLIELPVAIGRMSKLEVLRLRACTSMGSLPESISELKKLKFLNLSGCSNLSSLPETMGELQGLETIDVRGCSARLPVTVMHLKGLIRVICDEETEKMWKPFVERPELLDMHKAYVSLDFLQ